MWAEFLEIFSGMGLVSIITLAAGFVLMFTELFLPGFGVCGITGCVSLLVGVVFRIIDGASAFQTIILVVMLLFAAGIIFLVIVMSARRGGLITKTPLVLGKTAIPKDYGQKEYIGLLNKTGVVTTQCKPVGKAEIDGNTYQVMAKEGFLIKGVNIKVVEVSGDEIWVEKVKN